MSRAPIRAVTAFSNLLPSGSLEEQQLTILDGAKGDGVLGFYSSPSESLYIRDKT